MNKSKAKPPVKPATVTKEQKPANVDLESMPDRELMSIIEEIDEGIAILQSRRNAVAFEIKKRTAAFRESKKHDAISSQMKAVN
jgi:hypothetical protein